MQTVDAIPAVLYLFMPLFNVILFILICSHRRSILPNGIKTSRLRIVSFTLFSTGLLAAIIGAFGLTAILTKAHPRWLNITQFIVSSLLKFELNLLLVFIINNHLPDLQHTRRFWHVCCLLYVLVMSSSSVITPLSSLSLIPTLPSSILNASAMALPMPAILIGLIITCRKCQCKKSVSDNPQSSRGDLLCECVHRPYITTWIILGFSQLVGIISSVIQILSISVSDKLIFRVTESLFVCLWACGLMVAADVKISTSHPHVYPILEKSSPPSVASTTDFRNLRDPFSSPRRESTPIPIISVHDMHGSVLFASTTTVDRPDIHTPRKHRNHRSPKKAGPRHQHSMNFRKPSRTGSNCGLLHETSPLQSPACESFAFGSESDHFGEHQVNLAFSADEAVIMRDEAILTQVLLNMLDQEDGQPSSDSTHEHFSAYRDTLSIPPTAHHHRHTLEFPDGVSSTLHGPSHRSTNTQVSYGRHHTLLFPPSAYLGCKRGSSTSLDTASICGSSRRSMIYPASASSACDCCVSASFSLEHAHDAFEAGHSSLSLAQETSTPIPGYQPWPFFYESSLSPEIASTPQPSSICIPSMLQEAEWIDSKDNKIIETNSECIVD